MFSGEEGYMFILHVGLHNQGIIAFNLVTHIVYYYKTTEMGQSMVRGAGVHASPGDLQQSRHHYHQLGVRQTATDCLARFSLLIYGRAYISEDISPSKNKIVILDFIIFSFVDPPYFRININLSCICGEKLLLFE